MGRGGGGSSGGRSFSSGGGRSFGGRSSSSHRGGSSSSHRGGGGSSFRSSSYRPSHTHHYHHYGGGYGMPRMSTGAVGLSIICAAAAIIFLVVLGLALSGDDVKINGARMSTVERTALQPYQPFDKACVDDRAGWIADRNTLLRGMEQFYKLTGVQPAICITDDMGGLDAESFATDRYDALIGHEQGVLLLFYEPQPSQWDSYYMAGEAAQTVMDSEACDIMLDFVEAYYTSDMSEDEYFGAVFRETGERIMTVTPTVASKIPWFVCGLVAIVIVVAGVKALQLKHKRDRERAAETERILNTSVDRL